MALGAHGDLTVWVAFSYQLKESIEVVVSIIFHPSKQRTNKQTHELVFIP